MNSKNVTNFVRGGLKELPSRKQYIPFMLTPVFFAGIAIFICSALRENYNNNYRFLQLFLIIAVAVYVIVTLKISFFMALCDYLLLNCIIISMFILMYCVLGVLMLVSSDELCLSHLLFCLPMIISYVCTALFNYRLLKRNKEYVHHSLQRRSFKFIWFSAVAGVLLGDNIVDSHYETDIFLIGSLIVLCICSICLALCVQRLYYAKKYSINFD